MPLRLGTNITAINAGRHLSRNAGDFTKRVERLSSGMRINRGADDAAGLSVSEGMRADLLGMRQSVRNVGLGINMVQIAEGALNEVSNILIRIRELAVTSANSTINDTNRQSMTLEVNQLYDEIDRIAVSTTFGRSTLLTGFGNAVSQVGTTSTALAGFSGVTEIDIAGATPGNYVFSDTSTTDNQLTLSVDLPDGTRTEQSIDMGSGLDLDNGKNLVATGTTYVANFDRLGVQIIMVGAGVDPGTTLKTQSAPPIAGTIDIRDPGNNSSTTVAVAAGEPLATVAENLDAALKSLDSGASATFDADLGEILIETNGLIFRGGETTLGITAANAYEDGRLDGRTFVVEAGEGGVLQVGPNDKDDNRIALNIGDMRASSPTLNLTGLSVANIKSAEQAISRIDKAIYAVARQRGDLGAVQNRLEFLTQNLANIMENIQAAESSIRDADVAAETAALTIAQITTQAATAMVAQANSMPQTALRLLQ